MPKLLRALALVPLAAALLTDARAGGGVRLPDIGSSAGQVLSPAEQKSYGASMLHEMRAMNLVLDDPLLEERLDRLGYRLVAHSDKPDQAFTFFLVRDNQINAFAAPGGYIGVNTGLIVTTAGESELAAVLAHEISHITQQHLLRAFEDAQKTSLPIALAMLGALIASSHAGGDAAEAVLATGTSLIQQRQINFTRQDEAEADRVGIQTLARAGFDPNAMADFFARMDRALRPGNDDSNVPGLLRTHPVTVTRISDAKARAQGMADEQPATPAPSDADFSALLPARLAARRSDDALATSRKDSGSKDDAHQYALFRERVRVLSADEPPRLVAYYTDTLRHGDAADPSALRYGLALALLSDSKAARALTELQPLLAAEPDNPLLALAMARAELDAGRRAAALARFEALGANSPGSRPVILAYAQALLADGQRDSARKAQAILRPLIVETEESPEIYRSFARACELSGDTVRAALSYAEAAYLNGHAEDALNQLRDLAKRKDLDYYQRARVDARITEFTPVVLELRRRGTRPADQGRIADGGFSCAGSGPCASLSSRRNTERVE